MYKILIGICIHYIYIIIHFSCKYRKANTIHGSLTTIYNWPQNEFRVRRDKKLIMAYISGYNGLATRMTRSLQYYIWTFYNSRRDLSATRPPKPVKTIAAINNDYCFVRNVTIIFCLIKNGEHFKKLPTH